MDVSCPACAARYIADDEKLRGKTARMRCKACDTVWMVSGASGGSDSEAFPMSHAPIENESGAKRAAILRKGADREQRDLFAEQEPDVGSFKQTVFPPPSFGFTAVGARNENSVLFRVDQLTSAGRVKAPPAEDAPDAGSRPAQLGGDDEGIIDLKSLSSTAPRKVAVAPLFSEPPPVSVDVEDGSGVQYPVGKFANKKRLFAGVAAAATLLLVCGLGISFAFKSEPPVDHSAAVSAPIAVAPPPVEAPPPPPPVASTDTANEAKEAAKETKETKGKKGKGGRAKAAKSVATVTKAAAPAAKPAPKAPDPCGCKGDFNCVIACTAKGGK